MSKPNKNTGQESMQVDDDSQVEYVDPAELPPMGDEELFTAEINKMVAEDAPRVFALCGEVGDRVDAVTIAWGMAFDDHAEIVCTTHDSARGIFDSAERARTLLSAHDKIKVRLVWIDQAQEHIKAA